jgi:protein O-GlcNAc transferase
MPLDHTLQEAILHHQAGRWLEAEACYRQLLEVRPDHPDALHLLGVLAMQAGDHARAAELIAGAIRAYPSNPMSHFNLGVALQAQNKFDEAKQSYRNALSLNANYAEAHNNLALLLQAQGELDEAIGHYRKTLLILPDYAQAHVNLGSALLAQGDLADAAEHFYRALSLAPDSADAHTNLGFALHEQGELDKAIEHYLRALSSRPDSAELNNNLGAAFKDQGRADAAVACFERALSLKPDYAKAHNNLGIIFKDQGKLNQAVMRFHQALAIEPDNAEVHSNLGNALKDQGKLSDAVASYRRAISLDPDAEANTNLGGALGEQGETDGVVRYRQKAISSGSASADAYSNLLFLYSYHALIASREYLVPARGWERVCVPARERQLAREKIFQRPALAGRRLKVGYVSGDYCTHAVSYFIEQLFAHHDRARIELFAYSAHGQRDAVTARLQALADRWVSVVGIPDTMVLDQIESDGIDVLVDLSSHTAHNRLGVFARRAAPVQAHYLGYFASTGLTEMDYFIGDEILTPPETDDHFCEQVWRLPRVRACYDGKTDAPEHNWQPASDGSVRLGSFNNLGKITPQTVGLWAEVLHALPEGKLLLKTKELADAGNRRRILDAMAGHGISQDRIELQDSGATPGWREHMAYYDRLDIVLDPVGAHGGYTTTCDALWMGAPVIALEGGRMALRMAASILDALGHPGWIAGSEAEYVAKVVALARDAEQRKILRASQRERMAASPLCDAKGMTVSLENAYSEMFERWLNQR